MRLWHYKLLAVLPDSQLLAQKRECDVIWKDIKQEKKTKHILINYIWEYEDFKEKLYVYYLLLEKEFKKRNFKFNDNSKEIYIERGIIRRLINAGTDINPFPKHHDLRYLSQCFYNLDEKYSRGQKDFDEETYQNIFAVYAAEKIRCKQKLKEELQEEDELRKAYCGSEQ